MIYLEFLLYQFQIDFSHYIMAEDYNAEVQSESMCFYKVVPAEHPCTSLWYMHC